jgi:hypothetical protein
MPCIFGRFPRCSTLQLYIVHHGCLSRRCRSYRDITIGWDSLLPYLHYERHSGIRELKTDFVCFGGWQGKGEGQLELKVTYFPFELLYSKPRDASLVRPRPIQPTLCTCLPSALCSSTAMQVACQNWLHVCLLFFHVLKCCSLAGH